MPGVYSYLLKQAQNRKITILILISCNAKQKDFNDEELDSNNIDGTSENTFIDKNEYHMTDCSGLK